MNGKVSIVDGIRLGMAVTWNCADIWATRVCKEWEECLHYISLCVEWLRQQVEIMKSWSRETSKHCIRIDHGGHCLSNAGGDLHVKT